MSEPALPASRSEAAEIGAPRFLTGRKCGQGHVAARYTSSGQCVECARESEKRYRTRLRDTYRQAREREAG